MANANNRYALITGATSGFGYEFAKLFAADGYNLVIVARHEQHLDKTAEELSQQYGVEVVPLPKNLFHPEAPFEIYEAVKAQNLTVDVLVNNAGQGEWGKFFETDLERELDIIQLNVSSLVVLTKLFLKDMMARNEGKILQVSSLLGEIPAPLMAVYGASKAFVLKFSEALIEELKDSAVTLTVLEPGVSDTDFFRKAGAEKTKAYQESDIADPAEVARDGYRALMSGNSRIISGAKNQFQSVMANVLPDSLNAAQMHRQMSESGERNRPVHGGGDAPPDHI
ncbi:SDR family oxidoreductase [Paraflavisolibacter sp. H34]|uniref:SDR family NAD(P)-dependent oxidoreductase n=1 Tax=Huijunlia imazamoxiresistens TaxID=3127457 RepID=UPI003015FE3D